MNEGAILIREDEFVVSHAAQTLRSTRALNRQFLSNNGKEDVVQGSHNVDIDMGCVEKDMDTESFELKESDNCDVHVAES